MIKLAANLSFLYQETPFMERFERAALDGFEYVEYLFPYAYEPEVIAAALKRHNLTQALFNLSAGNWQNGERGFAALPDKQDQFFESLEIGITYAKALECKHLHVMSGIISDDFSADAQMQCYTENLMGAADLAAKEGITLLIEPINPKDMPGYFMNSFDLARQIIAKIDNSNLKLQFDIYHCQRMMGDVITHLTEYLPLIGHIQIANPPHRHEPSNGELNYAPIFELLDQQYDGVIGCEYKPSTKTGDHLNWAQGYLQKNQG
jgi:hydroxypyruvate isomerase